MIVRRSNQIHKIWKMNNILGKTLSNLSVDYQENINLLQSCNFLNQKKKHFEMHDIKIHSTDWSNFISNNCDDYNQNLKRIPGIMITYLSSHEKFNVLDSFLYFLLNDDRFHDPFIILSILNTTFDNNKNYTNNFIDLYEKIVPENVYDSMFSNYVKILLRTESRIKALNLLSKRTMNQDFLSSIITTSPNSETWNDIKHYVDEYLSTDETAFKEIEDIILSKIINEKSIPVFQSILKSLYKKNVFLKLGNLEQIQLTFKDHPNVQIVKKSVKNLKCVNCNSHLPEIQFPNETCYKLADILMDDVLNIKSIDKLYRSSTPEEIEKFFSFFNKCKLPFDCILDLPNVIGLLPPKIRNNYIDSHITTVLKTLLLRKPNFKNICFIGKHISKGRRILLSNLVDDICQTRTDVNFSHYFSNNCDKDDILTLFLALKSGGNCYIVTNDEFRDHRALITDGHFRTFFSKWQRARQIFITGCGNKMEIKETFLVGIFGRFFGICRNNVVQIPSEEDIAVHCDPITNIWHVPYVRENEVKLSFDKFFNWCCIKLPSE